MMADPYSPEVRQLFAAPTHAGDLDGARNVRMDEQGVSVQLSARPDNGRIGTLRFRAWGCPHLLAAAEAACAELEGRPAVELQKWSADGIMQNLAVPPEKTGRILVLEDTVRALGRAICDEP